MKWHLIGLMAFLLGIVSLLPAVTSLDSPPPKDAEFTYARIRYHMTPDAIYVPEVPWHHEYPFGDETFPSFVKEVSRVDTEAAAHQIVYVDSPGLLKYP